jgi:expansin (peptidoglycan-binding protein)
MRVLGYNCSVYRRWTATHAVWWISVRVQEHDHVRVHLEQFADHKEKTPR